MKNKIISLVVIAVILIAGAFYGGMKYGQMSGGPSAQNFKNMTPDQRQAAFAGARGTAGQGNRAGAIGGGNISGEILNQTEKNITIKMRDGSSKIVMLADSTKINKSVEGLKTDLAVGKQVMINGTANSDGTITAESVTLTPLAPAPVPPANQTK